MTSLSRANYFLLITSESSLGQWHLDSIQGPEMVDLLHPAGHRHTEASLGYVSGVEWGWVGRIQVQSLIQVHESRKSTEAPLFTGWVTSQETGGFFIM